MPDVQEVFRMATQKVRPEPGFADRQFREQRRRSRNRKLGALAVAAVIGIVGGVVIIRAVDEGTGTQPGGQPTGTTARPIPSIGSGPLEPGSYVISTPVPAFNASHRITIDVPDGFSGSDGLFILKNGLQQTGLSVWVIGDVYGDACEWIGTRSPVSAADEVVAALAGHERLRPSTPTDVTVDGYAGTYMELTVPATADLSDCHQTQFRLWSYTAGRGPRFLDRLGQHELLWILDVDGVPVVIDAPLDAQASEQDRAELEQIVESIRIDSLTG
jgi:hypothetical protein